MNSTPGDLPDDAVELALVERAAELPALAEPVGRAADERVEVGVERVGDVLLDALEVGVLRGLEVDDDADAAQLHRQQLRRSSRSPAARRGTRATSVSSSSSGESSSTVSCRSAGATAGQDVDAHHAVLAGRQADRAGDPRRGLAAEELEVVRRDGAVARPDLHRGARAGALERLGVDAAERRPQVRHRVDARDRALQHGERARRRRCRGGRRRGGSGSSAASRPSSARRRTGASCRRASGSPGRARPGRRRR